MTDAQSRETARRCDTTLAGAWTSSSGYVPPNCIYCGKPVTGGHDQVSWEAVGRRVYAHMRLKPPVVE